MVLTAPQHRPASNITDLIAKLEASAEGTHALDYEIYRAVHEYARNWLPDFPPGGLPQYTHSIDAALSLVPEGAHWRVSWPVAETTLTFAGRQVCATGGSAPLSLCIAALRARQGATP